MALPQANKVSSTDMLLGRILDEQRDTTKGLEKSIEVAKNVSKENIYVKTEKEKKGSEAIIGKPIRRLTEKSDFNIFGINKKLQEQQKQDIAIADELIKASEIDVGQSSFKQVFEDFKESVDEAGNFFSRHYKTVVSKITHDTETGADQIAKGRKALFDGLGSLGPAVNMMRTFLEKLRGGFDLIVGSIRSVASGIGKVFSFGKNIVKGTASAVFGIGSNPFAEDGQPESTQQEKASSEMQDSVAHGIDEWMNLTGNQTVLNHKELRQTIISALMDYNKLAGMGDTAQDLFRSKYAEDIGFLEDDVFDARKEQDEEEAEREKKQDKKRDKEDKKYFKDRNKKMKMFWLKQSLFASAMTILKFLLPLGLLVASIGIAWKGITEDGRGLAGAFQVLKSTINGFTRVMSGAWRLISAPFRMLGGFVRNIFGAPKTPTPANVVDDVARTGANAADDVARTGANLADDAVRVGTQAASGGATRIATGVGSKLVKALPLIGGILEGGIDVGINKETYNDIKTAYEQGLPFIPTEDGQGRQMTEAEFAEVDRVYKNSLKGSAGRTTGGTTGAIIGATIGTIIAPGIGTAIGGFFGGMFGSAQAEAIAEGDGLLANGLFGFGLLSKGDQTKAEIRNFELAKYATLASDTLETANNAIADEKVSMGSGATSVTSAVSNTNNNTAVENSYHLGDDFTDSHLQYSNTVQYKN